MKYKQFIIPVTRRALAVVAGLLLCGSIAGSEAAVVVYDAYLTGNVALSDPSGDLHDSYSGRTGFDIRFDVSNSGIHGIDAGAIGARAGFGLVSTYGSTNSIPAFFTHAFSAVEHRTRVAQADAVWEFGVLDSDTTFQIDASWEIAFVSCLLEDLTLGSLVATYDGGGSNSPYGGPSKTGALLQGHNYRLTQGVRINGYSDELAKMAFRVGTDVTFDLKPEFPNPVPESGGWLTNAAFLLTVGGMAHWLRRQGHRVQA